jgi:hypothetical protein
VKIVVRGDSGFCREELMRWCEQNYVDSILGLARNERLRRRLGREMHEARQQYQATGQAARVSSPGSAKIRSTYFGSIPLSRFCTYRSLFCSRAVGFPVE